MVVEEEVRVKKGKDLSAASMQSPDDLEATYRNKGGKSYVGHVVNVTETADPENDVQLITKVQVESNNVDDAQMLVEAIPELVERTELSQLYTDGGYGSGEVDELCHQNGIEQVQTAIRGATPSKEKLHLADFEIGVDEEENPNRISCPAGKLGAISSLRKPGRYKAIFAQDGCAGCPLLEQCPTHLKKKRPQRSFYFTLNEIRVASRRRRMKQEKATGTNLRAAVEATVRQISCRLQHGHLRVRGHNRVSMVMLASATMANLRRIWRHLTDTAPIENEANDTSNIEKQSQNGKNDSGYGQKYFWDADFGFQDFLLAAQTRFRFSEQSLCLGQFS